VVRTHHRELSAQILNVAGTKIPTAMGAGGIERVYLSLAPAHEQQRAPAAPAKTAARHRRELIQRAQQHH
jgi:hypothetical protein